MRTKSVYFFESVDYLLRESPNNACSREIGLIGRDVILTDFSIYILTLLITNNTK